MAEQNKEHAVLKPAVIIKATDIGPETTGIEFEVDPIAEANLTREDLLMLLVYSVVEVAGVPDDDFDNAVSRVQFALQNPAAFQNVNSNDEDIDF